MKKGYNLNIKRVILLFLTSMIVVGMVINYALYATEEQRDRTAMLEWQMSIKYEKNLYGCLYSFGFLMIFTGIYSLELLLYKRKNILEIDETGIVYYAPEYGKVEILKENIQDIYFVRTQLKIRLNKEYDTKLRAKFWNLLKGLMYPGISKEVFRINLQFIDCNIEQIQSDIMEMNLDCGSQEAKKIMSKIYKNYKITCIEELKENEKALVECIMELYNEGKLTQKEIAFFTQVSASKVSKIIKSNI